MVRNRFRESLAKNEFVYTLELVPGRGARGKSQDQVLGLAEKAARTELVDAVSITDNPGGHPTLFPNVIGREVAQMGITPLIHFTCKDRNRNQIESLLYSLDRLRIENLLAMTGDYPLYGFEGQAKPVYDLDSVQLIHLIGQMNKGICLERMGPGGSTECPPTSFFVGCAVSPFKALESELLAQYYKLVKKIGMGADYVVTQVGYDLRKFDELLRFLRLQGLRAPVLGNVYILNRPVARVMNRQSVPGCVVTDKLYRTIEEEAKAADKGRAARLTRAAKLIAVLKGIGYSGVHIGGPNLTYEDLEWLIGKSEDLAPVWPEFVREFSFPQPDGFYLFQKDDKTGLNTDIPNFKRSHPARTVGYGLFRWMHRLAFLPGSRLYKHARWFFEKLDKSRLEPVVTEMEYWTKFITSRCRRCGDCTLPQVAFLCPQSQCPKYQLNGQCGGSVDGWCEVFPGKRRCIYVRAYDRLKAYRDEESLRKEYIPPRNWELDQTSSWANYFLGRDHHAAMAPIQKGTEAAASSTPKSA